MINDNEKISCLMPIKKTKKNFYRPTSLTVRLERKIFSSRTWSVGRIVEIMWNEEDGVNEHT